MEQNELPLDLRHLGGPSSAPKMTSEPIARSVQTVHLSCVETNTIYKQTEMSLPLTHVPLSTIGYVLNDFLARGTFSANYSPILR